MFKKANQFEEGQINEFKKILLNGGEVSAKTFYKLIANNPQILMITESGETCGIGALKIPLAGYREKVFKNAKSDISPFEFSFELGWVVSLQKGTGNEIVALLSDSTENIYATVRENNNSMLHLLQKYGFKQTGSPFKSDRGEYKLCLLVKFSNPEI